MLCLHNECIVRVTTLKTRFQIIGFQVSFDFYFFNEFANFQIPFIFLIWYCEAAIQLSIRKRV